jgi:hypothetical protein
MESAPLLIRDFLFELKKRKALYTRFPLCSQLGGQPAMPSYPRRRERPWFRAKDVLKRVPA